MEFLENIVNGIPIVGHIKAGIHLLADDREGCDRAWDAASRSTVVMGAGAIGLVTGGPVGAVAGGMAAGAACDTLDSGSAGRPVGVISGVADIATDISNGHVPLISSFKTGLFVAADAVSGFGGGGLSGAGVLTGGGSSLAGLNTVSALTSNAGKVIIKDTAIAAVKSATCSVAAANVSREIGDQIPPSERKSGYKYESSSSGSKSKSEAKTSNSSGGSSGSDPPRDGDKRNQKDHEKDDSAKTESHFDALLKLFKASELGEVIICEVKIFAQITKAQKARLRELIKRLRNENTFERVIEAVRNIFNKLPSSEITFQNFLHLCEMVATYVSDGLARRMELQSTSSNRPTTPFHVRRAQNLAAILQEILQPGSRNNILNIFTEIRSRIATAMRQFYPTFGSEISAVYHYFKHKFVPDSTEVLTIEEYLQLVKDSLPRIQQSSYYRQLQNGQARRLVYDRYYERFRRRVRIVFQAVGDDITLSTCHILDDAFEGDYDGFEHYQTTK